MLDNERKLIKHHWGKEQWESPTSLAHQAARQDPGMFLLAAVYLDNHLVVTVPFKREGSFFVELDLDNSTNNMYMRIAYRPTAPGGRHLSLAWAGLSNDGLHIADSAKSSWGNYVVAHAQGALDATASGVQVWSACALGSAMLSQLQLLAPATSQNITVVTSPDRALAHNFIQQVREGILRNLKAAFRELLMVEQFYHQGNSYYTTFSRRVASDGDTGYNTSDPKRKWQRTKTW